MLVECETAHQRKRIGSPVVAVAPTLAASILAVSTLLFSVAPVAATESIEPALEAGATAARSTAARSSEAEAATEDQKSVAITNRMLLPYYEVEINNISGASTLFAVRNEGLSQISVTAAFYEIDSPQAPQRIEVYLLDAKQTKTVNIRDVPNLEVDEDGLARGFVVFETGNEDHRIHGDFFQVTPGQAFATGARLVDISSTSQYNELCSNMSVRFLSGGGFTGGTQFVFWTDAASLPLDANAISYSVYSEAGVSPVFTNNLPVDTVAGSVDIETLLGPFDLDFGAVEFQFSGDLLGTVAAVMSASGEFSVRVEATCRD